MYKIIEKRIGIIITIVAISIISVSVKKIEENKTISTMSVPVTNKIIVVDAGHRWRRWRGCKLKWNK